MAKATFPEITGNESSKPQAGGTQSSADVRNALSALFQGDLAPLRARAQSTPDMTVYVNPAVIQNFFAQVNRDNQPVEFAGGSSPTVTAPTSDDRIDILYLDSTGSLAWVTGTESATPSPDWASLPQDAIPICLVYCKPTMTKIVNYEDKDAYPNDGYIYRDVRPVIGGGGGADEKVKADASDPTEGYLSDKFDNETLEVDTATHKGRVKDGGISTAKLADSSVSQAKLKTATGEVSYSSGLLSTNSESWQDDGNGNLTLPGGEYGFYPQVKFITDGVDNANYFQGRLTAEIVYRQSQSGDNSWGYVSSIGYLMQYRTSNNNFTVSGYLHFYAQQRYITSSGKDHWIFLLVAKQDEYDEKGNLLHKKGQIIASYQAPDHPSANQGDATPLDIPHPFGSYDPDKHEIIVVDNEVLKAAKQRVKRKRSLLMVINEDFIIDDYKRPKYEPREIVKINEFPDEPIGKRKAIIKVPQWAKIVIQPEYVALEQIMVEKLPDFIKYKKMRLKKK